MPYRDFPPIYGKFDHNSLMSEKNLKKLLNLGEQDTCADWYGHYERCWHTLVECKGRHLRDAVDQLYDTASRLRAFSKPVNKAIIVADTFGNEVGLFRNNRKELYYTRGSARQPIYVESINGRILVEGWQPNEWEKSYF